MQVKPVLLSVACTLAAITPAAASAEMAASPGDVVVQANRQLADNQRLVSYRDLKLSQEAGRRALLSRVDHAIESLCDSSRFSVSDPAGSLKCSNGAWEAVNPQLTRLLASR